MIKIEENSGKYLGRTWKYTVISDTMDKVQFDLSELRMILKGENYPIKSNILYYKLGRPQCILLSNTGRVLHEYFYPLNKIMELSKLELSLEPSP